MATILDIPEVYDEFIKNNYVTKFKKGRFIMTPALYRQVYLGALGEVAGKVIIEQQTGYSIEEIPDYTLYEFFDFKIGNVYFDFKHWNDFIINHDYYCNKIRRKLNRVKGERCFIINLTTHKNTEYKCQNINNEIFIVPFLIDPNTAEISQDNINFILDNMGN